jgi:hypothetical protein
MGHLVPHICLLSCRPYTQLSGFQLVWLSLPNQPLAFTLLQTYVCVHVISEYVKKHVENRVTVDAAMVTVVSLHS